MMAVSTVIGLSKQYFHWILRFISRTGMRFSGMKVLLEKVGRNVTIAISLSFPVATVNSIAKSAALPLPEL